jgi:hypothetical protein
MERSRTLTILTPQRNATEPSRVAFAFSHGPMPCVWNGYDQFYATYNQFTDAFSPPRVSEALGLGDVYVS